MHNWNIADIWLCSDTSDVVCPCLSVGWSWGLLPGTERRGAGLPRITEVEVAEEDKTAAEAVCGSWLCWMKVAESGVSCLKAGRLLYRINARQKWNYFRLTQKPVNQKKKKKSKFYKQYPFIAMWTWCFCFVICCKSTKTIKLRNHIWVNIEGLCYEALD